MKLKTFLITVCFLTVFLSASVYAGAPDMNPGEWEITTYVEMEGMPFRMPPMKTVKCVTKEDLNDPEKTTPNVSKGDDSCEVKDYKMSGKKATWTIVCTGKNKGTGNGEMTYAGNSYKGKIMYETEGAVMNYSVDARRTGDCKK